LISSVSAQDSQPGLVERFSHSHQIGIRLGGWANLGGLPPETLYSSITTAVLETKISNANIYFEGFFGYRLNQQLMLELSMGISNRGSVTLTNYGSTNVGSVIIYPILLQMKLYPLSTTASRLQPYFFGGGGLYYGRRSTQISSSGYVGDLDYESETVFHYTFGGGIDLPLGKSIAADLNVKYMPVTFTKQFVALEDYKGLSITIGIKYLYAFKGDQKDGEGINR
jgi:outer membrane protein W